ncbi:MAG: 5-oxoprolinase subunit PxpB, partial [Verrucomicrobiae bacterium]|nr:5-oxoprolinase subunit PxpB [Verrucomicrobiae bacterium]
MPLEWSQSGPLALRVRFASGVDDAAFQTGRVLAAALESHFHSAGLDVEFVPAFTTLLLIPADAAVKARVMEVLSALPWPPVPGDEEIQGRRIELEVGYDGKDLSHVAAYAGVSETEVVALHSAPEYRVHCLGFSPGFPYLGGLNPRLRTPRLPSPRPRVPAGSVAIGGEQTGVYSVDGPGGWNLIGWTPEPIFRPWANALSDIFLMHPGDRVRFRPGRRREGPPVSVEPPAPALVTGAVPSLRLLSVGMGVTVQDPGRPGYRRFGVPPGGVMDPHAAAWANRLLENPGEAPVLELCLQGQRLEALESGWVAVTGSSSG